MTNPIKPVTEVVAEFREGEGWVKVADASWNEDNTKGYKQAKLDAEVWLHTTITTRDKAILEVIEGRKYVFERDKDDHLPEVYKHLKSKNEALTDLKTHLTQLFNQPNEL